MDKELNNYMKQSVNAKDIRGLIQISENDFKLEWMLQLLIYYSLLPKSDRKKIKKISVINVFDGIPLPLIVCPTISVPDELE